MLKTVAFCLAISTPALAQDADYQLNGATVHRHTFTMPQCLRVGTHPRGFDWQHDGPCGADDIAWLDEGQHIHFRPGLTKAQLEHALTVWMFQQIHPPPKHFEMKVSDCLHLPQMEGDPRGWWKHPAPCNHLGDIAQADRPGHFAYIPSVTIEQLQYGLTLALYEFSGMPVVMEDFAQYRGACSPAHIEGGPQAIYACLDRWSDHAAR
jgi:hypothetical protein